MGFVISETREGRFRRVHFMSDCCRVPGEHYRVFEDWGQTCPEAADFHARCEDRPPGREDESSGASSRGERRGWALFRHVVRFGARNASHTPWGSGPRGIASLSSRPFARKHLMYLCICACAHREWSCGPKGIRQQQCAGRVAIGRSPESSGRSARASQGSAGAEGEERQ